MFHSSTLDAPVFTDLSNNNVTMINNAIYSAQTSINVLSNVISQYMTISTTNTPGNQRKKATERNYGQSLTSVEVLAQLQKKEQLNQRKARASTKKTVMNNAKKKR